MFRAMLPYIIATLVRLLVALFLALLLAALMSGCIGLPTVTPSPTPLATSTTLPVVQNSTDVPSVTIIGNVWIRDDHDNRHGWLLAGQIVNAVCDGAWCYLFGGENDGLRFWRGCSSDNPAMLACRMR